MKTLEDLAASILYLKMEAAWKGQQRCKMYSTVLRNIQYLYTLDYIHSETKSSLNVANASTI